MEILVTNDDGIQAKGIKVLTEIMRQFGRQTVIAPKKHQSGMSMAVSLGLKQIAYKELTHVEADKLTWPPETQDSENGSGDTRWSYLDATPASCVKFGLNTIFLDQFPDVVVSGINHGSNAATASCYSGTLGAAEEAALNGIPAIGVSLDSLSPDADFSAVRQYFPGIFGMIMSSLPSRKGIFYNVNFPDIPASEIKGIRVGYQGMGVWIKEFKPWDPALFSKYGITPEMLGQSSEASAEEGEELYVMTGQFVNDPANTDMADHRLMGQGYISIVAHNVDSTDYTEMKRLQAKGFDKDF